MSQAGQAEKGAAEYAGAPLPIQASIDVALPVAAVFELCKERRERR
ncbi:MAG TPA: hypothetical protein VFN89_00260 [Solirubrobacterales bacterium]|nr:hypothetical protein [Solirubrobacterales bacterium]